MKIITPVTKLFDERQSVHVRNLYFHAIANVISRNGIGKMESIKDQWKLEVMMDDRGEIKSARGYDDTEVLREH